MSKVAIAGAIAVSAAIIMVVTYVGAWVDSPDVVAFPRYPPPECRQDDLDDPTLEWCSTAPRYPPPECRPGVSYGGPAIPSSIARESNAMALDMYQRMSADPAGAESNHVFSPLAVYMAASLLYEGARGETAEQLRAAFALDPDDGARRVAAAQAVSALRGDDPCTLLDMSDILWIDAGEAQPDAVFEAIARGVYGTDVRAVDFGDLAEGGLARPSAVLSTAARFEGTWVYQFSPVGTGQFWRADGTSVDADFMAVTAYFEAYGFGNMEPTVIQPISIPYGGGRLSMLAVMPPEADGLPGLAASITPELLDEWMNYPYPYVSEPTKLTMPAFEIRAGYSLNDILAGTGAVDAVAPGAANLSGVGPASGGPATTLATHDALLGVGGKGTGAQYPGWVRDSEPHWITLNRPFLFFIYEEESDAILLMGSLSNPSASSKLAHAQGGWEDLLMERLSEPSAAG